MKKTAIEFITVPAFLLLLAIASPVFSSRPFTVEDPGVAGKGVFQLEISDDYSRQDGVSSNTFLLVPVYGFTDAIEFSVESPFKIIRPENGRGTDGISDINLVIKTLFLNENERSPAFLLKTIVKLANGNQTKGLGSGDADLGFVAVVGKAFGPLVVNANLGYTFVGRKADLNLNNYLLYGVSGEYLLTGCLKLVGELYGEQDHHYDTGSFNHLASNPLLGITYQLSRQAIFDLGVRTSSATAGISFTF